MPTSEQYEALAQGFEHLFAEYPPEDEDGQNGTRGPQAWRDMGIKYLRGKERTGRADSARHFIRYTGVPHGIMDALFVLVLGHIPDHDE